MNGNNSLSALGGQVHGDDNVVLGPSSVTGARNILLGGGIISNSDDLVAVNVTDSTVAIPASLNPRSFVVLGAGEILIDGGNFPGTSLSSPHSQTMVARAQVAPGADVNIIDPNNSSFLLEYSVLCSQPSILGIFSYQQVGTIIGSRDSVNGFYRDRDVIKENGNVVPSDIVVSNPLTTANHIQLNVAVNVSSSAAYWCYVTYRLMMPTLA